MVSTNMRSAWCLWIVLSVKVAAEYQAGTAHKEVINLDASTFREAIKDPANPIWFLKFYAPWCGHCKKMAPVLDQVAPKLEGKMAIGKIDCTVHKPLCSEFKVRGFPTLMYSVDGQVMDYPGGRDAASITSFAQKMSGPSVHVVQSYQEAIEFAKGTPEGVAFLGYDPNSSETETQLQQIFNQVARLKQANTYFVWLAQDERKYSFIHKIENNVRPKSYEDHDTDITSITTESLAAWVQANDIPLVVEFGPNNFNRIGKSGRPLAVSVVDFDNAAQKKAIKDHMLSYAGSLSPKEAEKYYFGIMDGGKWAKFLSQFNVEPEENPQMIVMDVSTKKFYQNSTYKNMVEFMKAVDDGEIEQLTANKPKKTGILAMVETLFIDNFPYSLIVILVLVFGLVFLLVPAAEDLRRPYDRVTDEGDVIGDDDGDKGEASTPETKKDK